ncbi:MAG: dephospho-CoA kinase [Pseudonocardiaceae bacterium]|nr:dephospho-CoA kinase [Pseudonocardiaceae bacterium]
MLRVGLTGGIGAGKSTVAGRLAEHGAVLIDADQVAREVVEPGSDGLAEVVAAFGREVLVADGSLDRHALGQRVFADEEARNTLNGILHPRIGARTAELMVTVAPDAIVVHDVPLLVENNLGAGYHLVLVVDAPERARVRRLTSSRDMSEADARARIQAQATEAQRRAAADVWLDNGRSRDLVLAEVDALWADRLVPFEANVRLRRPAGRSSQPVLATADPSWGIQAERLMARVAAAAGERAHRIDHIGSTSVPGLDAKDVLDLQVVTADLDEAGKLADELINAGLVRKDGRWTDNTMDGAVWDKAIATNADPARKVNCHIRPLDSPAWREVLLLRDWLRAHPDGVREYADVKHRLTRNRYQDINDYADDKTPFIASALERAETWARHTGWRAGL